jgi:hypothetical protein
MGDGIDREGKDFVTVYYGVEYKDGIKNPIVRTEGAPAPFGQQPAD